MASDDGSRPVRPDLGGVPDAVFRLDGEGHITYVNAAAELLLERRAEELLGRRARDCFPATVEIVTQENTKANMEKMPAFADAANKHGMPDRTFKERETLLSGNDAIDLYHYGAAHTNGDAFVVFRNARVMHAGDVFANKGLPNIDGNNGGSGLAYGETIAKASAGIKNVQTVITRHNAMTTMTWQDFVDYGEFNRLYAQHARESLKAGKSAEQAAMDLKLPDKFKDYQLTGGRGGPGGNFGRLFEELKTAK